MPNSQLLGVIKKTAPALIITGAVLTLLMAGFWGVLIFGRAKDLIQPTKKSYTGLELAEMTWKYVENNALLNSKHSDMWAEEILCSSEKCFEPAKLNKVPPADVALVLKKLYVLTRDEKYLQKYQKYLDAMLNVCEGGNLRMCEDSFEAFHAAYKDTNDSKYLSAMLKVKNRLLLDSDMIHFYATRIQKLVLLYDATGDAFYLEEAKSRIARKGELEYKYALHRTWVLTDAGEVKAVSGCHVPLAEAYLYEATGDSIYAQNATGVIAFRRESVPPSFLALLENPHLASSITSVEGPIRSNIALDIQVPASSRMDIHSGINRVQVLLKLYNKNGIDFYRNTAMDILRYILANRMDFSFNPKITGDNSFFRVNDQEESFEFIKASRDNLRLILILLEVPDEKFVLL